MPTDGSDSWSLDSAQKAFAEFMSLCSGDNPPSFEEFCKDKPKLEADLRKMHEDWRKVARLLPEQRVGSLRQRIEHAFGDGSDPGIQHDSIAHVYDDDDSTELQCVETERKVRYDVRGEVARGGMGKILKVWDPELQRTLAMKVVRGARSSGSTEDLERYRERAVSRFIEEAQITGQLVHPGIVPVHEFGLDSEGRIYFTMQLVKGNNFRHIIDLIHNSEEGWTLGRGLNVILKVCEAMGYAHSKGVIHRDLKPANIMVGRFGETYVMDWGLARVMGEEESKDAEPSPESDLSETLVRTARDSGADSTPDSPVITKEGDVIGTPCYMSPEQGRGRASDLSATSDVYAVGALLYHLLSGRAPYTVPEMHVSPYTVLAMLLEAAPPKVSEINPDAPAELVEICEKAMSREPEDRYSGMLGMARDIEAYLHHRPIAARPPTLGYVLKLAIRRHKPVAITLLGAALLLLALAIFDGIRVRNARDDAEQSQQTTARLLDFASAEVLVDQASELFPPVPGMAAGMHTWLSDVDGVLSRLGAYRAELDNLPAGEGQNEERARLETAIDHMVHLEQQRPTIQDRLTTAESLERISIADAEDAWAEAIESIESSPEYHLLSITPQLGLVPLGPNPNTGLWEFWHVLSGATPEGLTPETDEIALDEESGMVLVLLPGGTYAMGSPLSEKPRVANESLYEADVDAFFLSKFEVTQAQWSRALETSPALWRPGVVHHETPSLTVPDVVITSLHPVESINWEDCQVLARRLDLRLPAETEWEYACRAGKASAYCWGGLPSSLEGNENVFDLSYTNLTGQRGGAGWNDGFPYHAPVGSFAANDFGMFDMHGNVSEWCADLYRDSNPPDDEPRRRVFRGGSWYLPLWASRSAFRQYELPGGANHARGVRLARDVRQ